MVAARLSITKTYVKKISNLTKALPKRTILALTGVLFLCLAVPYVTFAATSVSPERDPEHGFPIWYEDALGTRVGTCLDGGDPGCVLPGPDEGFNPDAPTVFPSNFPVEHFYYMAMSRALATPGGGDFSMEFAVEGAFLDEENFVGNQQVFGRVRAVGDGFQANSTYTVTHPYGEDTYTTDAGGRIARGEGTEDIGCAEAPCNFSRALESRVFNGFLRSTAAPAGYLGDNVSETTVTGGPLRQTVTLTGPGLPAAGLTTDRFTVSGKLFVPTGPCANIAPSAANPTDPANGATNVSTSPALRWTASTSFGTNCAGATNGYQVFLSQGVTSNPTTLAGTVGPTTTTFTPAGLQPNSTYSWKVRTTNGALTADSPVVTFTTANGPVLGVSSTPVYRLYNSRNGDHFYTTSVAERNFAISIGYSSEGTGFYASDTATSTPVYRLYNSRNGDHFYTTSVAERNFAISIGYSSEGTGFYAIPQ